MAIDDSYKPNNHHWIRPLIRGRFFWLLSCLVTFILISGEMPATATGRWESIVPFMLIMFGMTFAARVGRKVLIATLILNLIFIIALIWFYFAPSTGSFCLALAALVGCLILALLSTLGFVLSTGTVGADHIMGAICAYVIIAMLFATIYTLQWLASPDAFVGIKHDAERPWAELLYFSFTTLSTVGYGDIVPATLRSRSVVIVEQLTGTFYVAVLIARLAGLYPPREDAASTNSPESPKQKER